MSTYRRTGFSKQYRSDLPGYTEQDGRHGSEADFDTFDRFCGPGRINTFDSPPSYRMRMVYGDYWDSSVNNYRKMGPNTDLIEMYKTMRALNKVTAKGAGHEPNRWGYKWPDDALARSMREESRGLSMKPFLDMLKMPTSKRPSNVRECINFFYPLSGTMPPVTSASPFVSTSTVAYHIPDANPNSPGNLPLQLGEVSMMYGWYLVWRMILCPETYADNIAKLFASTNVDPEFPFTKLPGDLILDPKLSKSVTREAREDIEFLADVSTALRFVEEFGKAAATSGVGMPDSLEDVKAVSAELLGIDSDNFASEVIHKYGVAYVASTLAQYVKIPYTHLNDIASVVVNGAIAPGKWESIKRDRTSLDDDTRAAAETTHEIAREYVKERLMRAYPSLSSNAAHQSVNLVEDFILTGIPSTSLQNRISAISGANESQLTATDKALRALYAEKSAELRASADRLVDDFTKYGDARPNPEPISLAVVGISAAGSLVQGGLDYLKARAADPAIKTAQYLTDNVYRLDENLQSGDASFDLTRHIRQGVWSNGDWVNSKLRPHCRIQQGGQVLDYWTHVWSRASQIIRRMREERGGLGSTASGATDLETIRALEAAGVGYRYTHLFRKGEDGVGYPPYGRNYRIDENFVAKARKSTYRREESKVAGNYTRCQSLGILAKHTDASMRLVLDHLDIFSPFTHAYGFCPTAQLLPNGHLKVNGVAPRRYLGGHNLVYRDSEGRYRAAAAPGRLYPKGRIDLNNAYGPHGVECRARKAPLPSRRLLRGAHGQRCNLSFDVGLDPHIPVMDAQFAGLMATLLSHPEALRTCGAMGLPWAKPLLQDRTSSYAALARRLAPGVLRSIVGNEALLAAFRSPRQVQFRPELLKKVLSADTSFLRNLRAADKAADSINHLLKMKRDQAQMSTPQKVAAAAATLAFGGALGYIGHRIYKAGK
jgi:hypothetical protein